MRVEDALAAKEAGADFVGIMFARGSRRRLAPEDAQPIVAALGAPLRDLEQEEPPPLYHGPEGDTVEWFRHGAEALERLLGRKRPLTVGVFQDQSPEEMNTIADECGLDLVQLSGNEAWADCLLANRQVIKGIDVAPGASGDDVLSGMETGSAIACLLDVSRGRGVAVDRTLAAAVAARMPVWLAGGLTPENVADAVRDVKPWAVDASSGVETDGAKDADKIRAFVSAAKEATGV